MPNLEINIATTADTSGAVQARTAVKDLTGEVRTGSGETENYREKTQQLREGMHMISLMTGGEVREGFHETGLGLKLLGSLTGQMNLGILGIAAAAGTAIPVVVGYFKEMYEKSAEEAKKAAEVTEGFLKKSIDEVGKLVAEASAVDDARTANRLEASKLISQRFTEEAKAMEAATLSQISNAEKLRVALNLINEALGKQIDNYKNIKATADAEAAKITQTGANKEADIRRGLQGRVDSGWEQSQTIAARDSKEEKLKKELEEEDAQLKILREKNEEYAKAQVLLDSQHTTLLKIGALLTANPAEFFRAANIESQGRVDTGKSGDARKENDELIARTQNQRTETLDALNKLSLKSENDEEKLKHIQKDMTDQQNASDVELDSVSQTVKADTTAVKAKEVLDLSKANTDKLKDVLGKVTVTIGATSPIYDDAENLVASGLIGIEKLDRGISDIGKIIAGYQAHAIGMTGNYTDNLNQLMTLQAAMKDQKVSTQSLFTEAQRIRNEQDAQKAAILQWQQSHANQ